MGNLQGKTIKVGSRSLLVQKLIAEGGFSFVFLVKDTSNGRPYALKRVLAHDKEQLRVVQNEIKTLSEHKNIVQFYDSTSVSKGDTTEVYILMEYCAGGHVVDLMNNRQSRRFSEQEIVGIFLDTCMAVAHMHSQDPPMAHRDLKVENILLDDHTGVFKLCDFGSVSTRTITPTTKAEIAHMEEDIQKYTTLAYRAPEMIDFYQNRPISEKVDIWALGCVLYKLAFFTTPFEEGNSLQILNVNYTIPATSTYSPQIHNLIKYMLNPDPEDRPDIFDVLEHVCKLKGVQPPPRKHPKQVRAPKPAPAEAPKSVAHPPKALPPTPTASSSAASNMHHHHNLTPTAAAAASIFGTVPTSSHAAPPSSHVAPPSSHVVPPSTFHSSQSSSLHPPATAATHALSPSQLPRAHDPISHPRSPGRPQLTVSVPGALLPPPTTSRRGRGSGQHNPTDPRSAEESPVATPDGVSPNGVSPSVSPAGVVSPNPGLAAVEACVKAATESSTSPPDIVPIKRLATITWETANNTSFIFDAIMKRPLTDPVVSLKAFDLVLRLLHDGHRQVLIDVQACTQLFFNLHLGWGRNLDRAPELAGLLSQYALVIYHKVMLHQRLPQLDGLLGGEVDWSMELGMQMLDLVAKIFGMQPLLGGAVHQFADLLAFVMAPIIQEVHAAYSALVICIQRLDPHQEAHQQLLPRVQHMFSMLQEFYSHVVSIMPSLPTLMNFPSLPSTFPATSATAENPFTSEADAFNPFGESTSDSFFTPIEVAPITTPPEFQQPLDPASTNNPTVPVVPMAFPRSSSLSSLVVVTPASPHGSPVVKHRNSQFPVSLPSSAATTPMITPINPFYTPQLLPGMMERLDLSGGHPPPLSLAPDNPFTPTYSSASAPSSPNFHARAPTSFTAPTPEDPTASPRMLRTSSSLLSQPPASRRSTVHRRAQSSTTSELARRTLQFTDPRLVPK